MTKVAVLTDSSSGISQQQAKTLGLFVLPMPFMMAGEPFLEGVDMTQELFFEKLLSDADISTSQPIVGSVIEMWEKLLQDYDEVVHIPMSSGLSAACDTAIVLSREYDGRVQVVNNQRISVTQKQSVLDAVTLAEAGWSAVQIKEYLEKEKYESSIYIMLNTLKYIKKGGRITAAGAAIGTLLNIKPVLQIQGEKLDSYAKARGVKQGRAVMIEAMKNDFNTRFAGRSDPEHMWLMIAYTYDLAAAEDFKKEVEAAFPGYDIQMDPLSLNVTCHIGTGALAIACSKKIDCL